MTAGMDVEDQIFLKQYLKDDTKLSLGSKINEIRKAVEIPKTYQIEELLGVLRQIGNN